MRCAAKRYGIIMPRPISAPVSEALAAEALSHMGDDHMFNRPLPRCRQASGLHDWSIAHNKQVTEQFLDAVITSTYRVAIVCGGCGITLGFG